MVAAAAAAAKSLQSCPTVRPHRRQPARLLCPWDSPGKNTGVGCNFLHEFITISVYSNRSLGFNYCVFVCVFLKQIVWLPK